MWYVICECRPETKADSTMYYMYVPQLKSMAEYNRELLYETSEEGLNLQTEYDY